MTNRQVGRVNVINRKEADDSGTVMTSTLTFNSTPLVILFDFGGTHSFISSKAASQIGVESYKHLVDLYVNLPNETNDDM